MAAVTVASMNTEIRDHLNFLKGALDLLTNSTTADTGTATYLNVNRTLTSDSAFRAAVSGDTSPRIHILATGEHQWGSGTAAGDVNLYRFTANVLRTDDRFDINAGTGGYTLQTFATAGDSAPSFAVKGTGHLEWGAGGASAVDTNLYREAANSLRTDDLFTIERTATTSEAFGTVVDTDTNLRFRILASGEHQWGPGNAAQDVVLYRSAADILMTDDFFSVGAGLRLDPGGIVRYTERVDPGVSAADTGYVYMRDNGAGKTQYVVQFATGAVQVIATQP